MPHNDNTDTLLDNIISKQLSMIDLDISTENYLFDILHNVLDQSDNEDRLKTNVNLFLVNLNLKGLQPYLHGYQQQEKHLDYCFHGEEK